MSKICNSCGKSVDDGANFCPYCKCNTFRKANELAAPNDDLIHKLFYWSYPQGSMLSKTKLATALVFIYFAPFASMTSTIAAGIILGVIFALITLLVGIVAHKIKGQPPENRIIYNDYGFGTDLKHLFFYWQEKNGGFVLSKTKMLSFVIFLLGFAFGLYSINYMILFGAIFVGVIFEVPVFAIGTVIHKLTNDGSDAKPELPQKPKKEIKQAPKVEAEIPTTRPKVIPEYLDYQLQLDDLNKKFSAKEKSARELIAKRFEPPQLTYTRFISGVDKSSQLFKKHRDSAYTMINLADEYSPRIASEVEAKIGILEEITDKIDTLTSELIVNDSITTKEDVDDLIGEMDNLIKSVKDYDS